MVDKSTINKTMKIKLNMARIITRTIRSLLSDKKDDYIFHKVDPNNQKIFFPQSSGLYIHVPFCTSMCPYCPYYKEYFDKDLAQRYKRALLKEIEQYGSRTDGVNFTSLYIGGGTPTLIIDDLAEIIVHIRKHLNFNGVIGLETTPKDLTHDNLKKLKEMGVNLLSLGVQSFNDECLKSIGRNYKYADIKENLDLLKQYFFDTVNFDMIFVLPEQSLDDIKNDLDVALSHNPHQITYYPLFTFPYTSIGKFKKLRGLKLPNVFKRRKMYYFIHQYLEKKGFKRTSVWSFNKGKMTPYSSVTRDFYLGLGPGAGSYTKEGFYFNTFSVREYVRMIEEENRLPLALKMNVSERMAKLFWLYWRLYETKISDTDYRKLFKKNLKSDFSYVLKALRWLGFTERDDDSRLNTRGTHWIHLMQNYFALNYVTEVWIAFKKNPHPESVPI